MACEICLRIMLEGKDLNVNHCLNLLFLIIIFQVMDVVRELRTQRAGSIQTESQYIYLNRALCEYVHAKKLVKDELAKFFQSYADYRKSLIKPVVAVPNAVGPTSAEPLVQAPPTIVGSPSPLQPPMLINRR